MDQINWFEPPARAFLYIGLMVMMGVPLAWGGVILPVLKNNQALAEQVITRFKRAALWGGLLALLGSIALFLAQVAPLEMELDTAGWLNFIGQTTLGQITVMRVVILALAIALAGITRNWRMWAGLWVGVGMACYVSITRAGHVFSMNAGALALAANLAHLLSGALWGGGLAALALFAPIAIASAGGNAALLVRASVLRFSLTGILGAGAIIASGLVLTSIQAPAPSGLNTAYGLWLLLKVMGLVVALAMAAAHHFIAPKRVTDDLAARGFARTVLAETLILVLVFAGAALLSATPPPHAMHVVAADGSHIINTDPNFTSWLGLAALGVAGLTILALALDARRQNKIS